MGNSLLSFRIMSLSNHSEEVAEVALETAKPQPDTGNIPTEVDPETQQIVLGQWWARHNRQFSLWWLSLGKESKDLQRYILLSAVPDMPLSPAEQSDIATNPSDLSSKYPPRSLTDILLPELTQDGLLASGGQLLILLLARRLVAQDLYFYNDVMALKRLHDRGLLPSLSRNKLDDLDTPFVDPMDTEERVCCLSADTSPEYREQVKNLLQSGRLINADVFMALKIRRAAMCAFMVALVAKFEQEIAEKPSPTFEALLQGEIIQLKMQEESAKNLKDHESREEESTSDK